MVAASRPPGYPEHLETYAVVADGGVVHVRPLVPEDKDRLAALIQQVSDQTAYMRYFSRRRPLRPEELERFVTVDYRTRLALGVEVGGELVATGQYDTDPESGRVEVAFLVRDDHQGRGIGTLLLEHLAAEARRQGIRTFYAETLGQNRQMLRVFAHAGLPLGRELDHGIWEIEMRLDPGTNPVEEQHEHLADVASVSAFLRPEAVAVVTAPGAEQAAETVVRHVVEGGYTGALHVVHPDGAGVAGRAASRSLEELGQPVDLAVVSVPPGELAGTLSSCGQAGIRGALVVSPPPDGPAEELRAAARRAGIRVLGPSSMGVVSNDPAVRLRATLAAELPPPGRVAFLSQSGNLGLAVLAAAADVGLGLSAFVSFGGKVDVSSNDVLQYLEDDPGTDVLCLYLHSFGNPRKFARIARRLARRKPIVVVRSGRSGAARRAPWIAGEEVAGDEAVEALFRQAGLIRVESIEEMLDTARVLVDQPLPTGPRVGLVGNGAGLLGITADACTGAGLEVPLLPDGVQAALEAAGVSPFVANPVDLGERAGVDELRAALSVLAGADGIDAVLAVWAPSGDEEAAAVHAVLAETRMRDDRPLLATVLGGREARVEHGEGRAVPVFAFPEAPARALARGAELVEWRAGEEGEMRELAGIDPAGARAVAAAVAEGGVARVLEPAEVDALLAAYGVARGPVPDGVAFRTSVRNVTGFGQVLSVGIGGPLGAAVGATARQLVPVTDADAVRLVEDSGAGRLLEAPGDVQALAELVERIARLADDVPEILELDCDPVAVSAGQAIVGGARARLAPVAAPLVSLRRLR